MTFFIKIIYILKIIYHTFRDDSKDKKFFFPKSCENLAFQKSFRLELKVTFQFLLVDK